MCLFFRKRKKKKAEAARLAEEARKAEELKLAEEARKAEEEKKLALEAEKAAEAARKAEEAKKAEAARKAAEAKKAEEAKKAAEAEAKKAAESAVEEEASDAAEPTEAEEPAEETVRVSGKFEIKHTGDSRFVFNLRAGNTQIIATSQVYSALATCKKGIQSVAANAPVAAVEDQTLQSVTVEKCPKFQIYLDKGGKYRFNLLASNGQNILSCTQGYKQKASCKNGIQSVINNALAPTVILEEENQ